MTYTKLDALRILSNAYHHTVKQFILGAGSTCYGDSDASVIFADMFGRVRRSLRLEDLEPCKEGFNGKGPRFF